MYLTVSYQHAAAAGQIETSNAEHRRVIFQFRGAIFVTQLLLSRTAEDGLIQQFLLLSAFSRLHVDNFCRPDPTKSSVACTTLYQRPLPQNLSRVCKQCSRPITAQDSVC